jgi:ferric-dicitrate binding protein FerR (iron transport regulator)
MKITEEVLIRFLECRTTPDEEIEILDWLDADPSNQKLLDKLDFEFSASILNISKEMTSAAPKRGNIFRRAAAYAAAAAAAVILVIGNGHYQSEKTRHELESLTNTIDVPAGQRICMTLQDGTKVWLNAGASMKYPSVFTEDSREVNLFGEAMFDVTKDSRRPFKVKTFAGDIEVLGTKFNVIADPETKEFSTALFEGKVLLSSENADEIMLTPGEKAELIQGQFRKSRITSPDEYLWTEGIISLESDSFLSLLSKMEKAYDVRFIIQRKDMPTVHCKGKIRISDGIEHVLEILKMGTDFEYEIRKGSNEIHIR